MYNQNHGSGSFSQSDEKNPKKGKMSMDLGGFKNFLDSKEDQEDLENVEENQNEDELGKKY